MVEQWWSTGGELSLVVSLADFSQISLTFKKSVESNKEELYRGEAVVALSSQGAPAQQ